jgi:hypothetical protein
MWRGAFLVWRITLTICYLARPRQKMLAQEIYRDGDPGSGFNQFSDFILLRGLGSCPLFRHDILCLGGKHMVK